MVAKTNKRRFRQGLSLVDVLSAIVVLVVMLIGAADYRYYAALDHRKATMQVSAAGIGVLLCEGWRGVKGSDAYNPTTYSGSDLVITAGSGPDEPEGFTLLGSYTVELNSGNYYTTLSWKDVYTELRALNTVVSWTLRGQEEAGFEEIDQLFRLTTYTAK